MLLNKSIQIIVFKIDNDVFEQLGDISQYTSLIWPDNFNGYAIFELWAPITIDNAKLLKQGNVIWTGGENAAVIEIVKAIVDENGNKELDVKGRTLEKYLTDRIIWGAYTSKGYTSTIMYDLVDKNCINPDDLNRKIPWLENSEDAKVGKDVSQYQKTGGEVYEALVSLATDSDIGFSVLFDPRNKKLIFEVRAGIDRTYDNPDGNDPVVFSTDLEDILSSSYYSNDEDKKTTAMIQGEDKGAARKTVFVGETESKGFNRRELYVDARDLQSEIYGENGETTVLTEEQYLSTLTQRGNEKLAECVITETFEAQIRQFGDVQYEFGKDYAKGDKVSVIDKQLGVQVSARITEVEEDFDSEYNLILTFGYSYPTMLTKVKRMLT
ncbi:MAG: siphovirus ReqiPepy6 Gp37-like family protein [Lachnospiraceae bacterium]|nr:siphovirus ReqiPepy6 Gp37-like family protein [Lachnospiraceae bacterium]